MLVALEKITLENFNKLLCSMLDGFGKRMVLA